MHPVLLKIGSLTLYWFGVMAALGFAAGLINWFLLSRRARLDPVFCSDLLFWLMVGGIVGARLAYVAADLRTFLDNPVSILFIHQGGLIFYGGFVGGGVALVAFARRRGERPLRIADFAVTSLPLAHVFGRMGCFLNGCCHGKPTRVPGLGVTFPAQSFPWYTQVHDGLITQLEPHTVPVHAVQLYEAGLNALVFALLLWTFLRRRRREGQVTATYLLAYPLVRFGTEFLRGDPRMHWGALTLAQWISLGIFTLGGILLWRVQHAAEPVGDHAER